MFSLFYNHKILKNDFFGDLIFIKNLIIIIGHYRQISNNLYILNIKGRVENFLHDTSQWKCFD